MLPSVWIDVDEQVNTTGRGPGLDRNMGFPAILEDAYEEVDVMTPRVIIVSHGKVDAIESSVITHDGNSRIRPQVSQQPHTRKTSTRHDSTDVDWATGVENRSTLTPRQRLEIKRSIEMYDTAYEQFARLYAAFHAQRPSKSSDQTYRSDTVPFVPEIYHVHVAYTALMHAYLHLIVLERDFWDQKSTCLGVESLFSAFRNFLGQQYRGVSDWPIDFDAKLPSMEGYFERLQLQYQMRASKMATDACGDDTGYDGAVEEVSDFEEDGEQMKRIPDTGKREGSGQATRRRGSSQKARSRCRTNQASSTSAPGFATRRRKSR